MRDWNQSKQDMDPTARSNVATNRIQDVPNITEENTNKLVDSDIENNDLTVSRNRTTRTEHA